MHILRDDVLDGGISGLTFRKTNHEIADAADSKRKALRGSMYDREVKLRSLIHDDGSDVTLDRVLQLVRRNRLGSSAVHPVLALAMPAGIPGRMQQVRTGDPFHYVEDACDGVDFTKLADAIAYVESLEG